MNRMLAVFLSLVYLCTTTGIKVTAHYCGSSISSVSFFEDAKTCTCPAKMKKKGCCSTESKFVQLKEVHKFTSLKNIEPDFSTVQQVAIQTSVMPTLPLAERLSYRSNAPPDNIYLRNSVLRT